MKVLLIEDSKLLQQSLSEGLRRLGYAVDCAEDGEVGLWFTQSNSYDVIVLDLMLPKVDGFTVLQRMRQGGNNDNVVILTAKDAVPDRVAGLDAGADDYLPKPFEFDELLARIRALTRRKQVAKNPLVSLPNGLLLDTNARTVTRHGKPLLSPLTAREYSLLEFMAYRKGQVVSRTEIEHRIYDERAEPMSNVVDVAVCTMRRKLDVPGEKSIIQTRRGMGYVLAPDMETPN